MGTDLFSPDKCRVLVFTLSATPTLSFTYPTSIIFPFEKVSETAPLVWRRKSAGSTAICENPALGVLPRAKQKCPGITV